MIEPRMGMSWIRVAALSGLLCVAGGVLAAQAPPPPGPRPDGQIETDVVRALDSSRALKGDLITAATVNGAVTLNGTVATEASRELAEAIVARVVGVVAVRNLLEVGDPRAAAMTAPEPPAPPFAEEPPAPPMSAEGPGELPQQQDREVSDAVPPPPQRMPYVRPGESAPAAARIPEVPTPQPVVKPVTIAAGTLLQLRTDEPVSSKLALPGQAVQMTVVRDVLAEGALAIPRGATVHGQVVDARPAGAVSGNAELALKLTSMDLGGKNYPLESDLFKVRGPGKGSQTVGNALAAGLVGTLIGCAAGGGTGCAIGAGAGVAAGTVGTAASKGPSAWIPAEAQVDFHLTAALTVEPVNQQEALRLSQGVGNSSGPHLNQRGNFEPEYRPYAGAYPGYYPGYSPYPRVFFRPYIVMRGGYHYWR